MLRYVPYHNLISGYRRSWLTPDIIAGLTVWAVLIPEGMAYGTIAGLPPIYGLYAVPAVMLIYAAIGSSRHLVVSVTSANAALSAGAVGAMAAGGSDEFTQLTIALALLVGVITTVAGLLRLGFIANFISEPVLKGFIIGLALTIIVGQLPKLFGIEGGSGNFFQKTWDLIQNLGDTSGITLVIGAASLGLIMAGKLWAPRLPASLLAVALAIITVSIFDLDQHGVAIVGTIDGGFPPFGLPDGVSHSQYLDLAPAAFGIMLVSFAQGLAAAQTYAAKEHYTIDANRELFATGVMNIGAGLTSGIAVGGSLSTTAVNGSAGARSQVSGLVTAGMTLLTLLFLMFLFEDLPEATLGAVVIGAVIELVDIPRMVRLYRMSDSWLRQVYGFAARADFLGAVAALGGVLIFDVLRGLAFGMVVSIVLLVYRTSRPRVAVLGRVPGAGTFTDVARHPENEQTPGIVIVRIDGEVYFANAQHVGFELRKHAPPGTRALIIDAEAVASIDVTSLEMFHLLVEDLDRQGTQLLFARSLDQVREQLKVTGELEMLKLVYPDVPTALAAVESGEFRPPPPEST